jgi:serine/threonine protein phosphatase PrpC
MRQTIAFGVAAQQGNWPAQEDGYFADPQGRAFVIADGFGGRGNGDLAARLALKELGGRLARRGEPGVASQAAYLSDINKIILEWKQRF